MIARRARRTNVIDALVATLPSTADSTNRGSLHLLLAESVQRRAFRIDVVGVSMRREPHGNS